MSDMIPTVGGSKEPWFKTPENWTQAGLLALVAAGLVFFWGSISAFVLSMLVNTAGVIIMVVVLFAMLWILFSRRSHMLFRLLSRWLTGFIVKYDPVGLLEDKVLEMKKRKEKFGEQVAEVSGQRRTLSDLIERNNQEAAKNLAEAAAGERIAPQTKDSEKRHAIELESKLAARRAGRLKNNNASYQKLLDKLTVIYNLLTRWDQNLSFLIEDTTDQKDQLKISYKATNSAYRAIKTGMAILRGNASDNDLYDRATEHILSDISMKLGAIDDFQRVASTFMAKIDIENAAIDDDAMKQLEQYEQKLLTSGDEGTKFLLPALTGIPTPEPVKVKK